MEHEENCTLQENTANPDGSSGGRNIRRKIVTKFRLNTDEGPKPTFVGFSFEYSDDSPTKES